MHTALPSGENAILLKIQLKRINAENITKYKQKIKKFLEHKLLWGSEEGFKPSFCYNKGKGGNNHDRENTGKCNQ